MWHQVQVHDQCCCRENDQTEYRKHGCIFIKDRCNLYIRQNRSHDQHREGAVTISKILHCRRDDGWKLHLRHHADQAQINCNQTWMCQHVLRDFLLIHLLIRHKLRFQKSPPIVGLYYSQQPGNFQDSIFLYYTALLIKSDSKTQHLIFDLLADITSRHQYLRMRKRYFTLPVRKKDMKA